MSGDDVRSGDVLVIRPCWSLDSSGMLAVVAIDDPDAPERSSTLKRVYVEGLTVRLRSSNPRYPELRMAANQVQVRGNAILLLRGGREIVALVDQ